MNRSMIDSTTALEHVTTVATTNASQAMQDWTGGAMSLELTGVREVALEDAIAEMGIGDDPVVSAVLQIQGELAGDIVLMFDEAGGKQLTQDLIGGSVSLDDPWSELQCSALLETGNILASAYLNSLGPALGVQLSPSPPAFVQDFGSSLFEQVLMMHALSSETVIVSRTAFRRHRDSSELDGNLFVVPSAELTAAIHSVIAE